MKSEYLPHIVVGVLILLVIAWLYMRDSSSEDMEEEIDMEDDDDMDKAPTRKINN
jgi:hypothetical protein